jgi:hypothetical protein
LIDNNSKGSKTLTKKWKDMKLSCFSENWDPKTGIEIEKLKELGKASVIYQNC